jgi:hypothetical protein
MHIVKTAGLALLLPIAGCATGGNFSVADSTAMSAAEIQTALTEGGKSFTYSGAGTKGTILYAANGTSLYTEDGKGTGTGKWRAADGQLCQSFDPASFLPGGRPETCTSFARSGSGYAAGPITLTADSG